MSQGPHAGGTVVSAQSEHPTPSVEDRKDPPTKQCQRCLQVMEASAFGASSRSRDRLQAWCRKCQKIWHAQYRATPGGREARLRAQRRYARTPGGKATNRASRERRYFGTDAQRAHRAVLRATQSGQLKRPSQCEQCGTPCHPDAHHHLGYAPEHHLTVQWLCLSCHQTAHRSSTPPPSATR